MSLKSNIGEYKNYIQGVMHKNHDDFMFSLKNSKIIDESGNYDYEKIRFYGKLFSDRLYKSVEEYELDTTTLMENIVNHHDAYDSISVLALICFYHKMICGWLPMDIMAFAADSKVFSYFLKIFAEAYRNKLSDRNR